MESTRIFDFSAIFEFIWQLLPYLAQSLFICIAAIILGSVLGAVLCAMQLSGNRGMSYAAKGYSYIMRCTPSIVMLFIVYYGLPKLAESLFGLNLNNVSRTVYAILAFALIFAAYIKEVFRAAYLSVPKGQFEAAACSQLNRYQTFYYIILPQMQSVMLPNFANSSINLVKESSVAYSIGIIDLIGKGNELIARNYGAYGIEVYLACTLIYFATTLLIAYAFKHIEIRVNQYKQL